MSQQSVSALERSEKVDEKRFTAVAEALGVSPEGIKNFSEEAILNIIGNTYNVDNSSAINYGCTFNPLDKMMELVDENKKLYERIVQLERERGDLLEKMYSK